MLKPINDYVLVKVEQVTETKSGLNNPKDIQGQEYGKVVDPGINEDLEVGQRVYFKNYSAIPIAIDGEDHHFVKYEEIIAAE